MTYDDWKAREPGPDGIGCLECKTEEARPGSNYCCEACEQEAERRACKHGPSDFLGCPNCDCHEVSAL